MATTLTDGLNDQAYKSWLKSGLILKHLKEGLVTFLETETNSLQQKCLSDIQLGLPAGSTTKCTKCNNALAKRKVWQCRTSNICTTIKHKLDKNHVRGKGKLMMDNTDVSLWTDPSKSWEIAKCFMSAGYKTKCSAKETDCTGLLGLVINCKWIHNKFTSYLIQPTNVFEQVRDIRNKVMHSSDLISSSSEVHDLAKNALKILEDQQTLLTNPDAVEAARKIKEIQTTELSITHNEEMQVLKDTVEALETGQVLNGAKLKYMLDEHSELKERCSEIESKTKLDIDNLKKELEEKEIKMKRDEGMLNSNEANIKQVDAVLKSINTVLSGECKDIRANMEIVVKNNRTMHDLVIENRQRLTNEMQETKSNLENIMKRLADIEVNHSEIKNEVSSVTSKVTGLESQQYDTRQQIAKLEINQSQIRYKGNDTSRQDSIKDTVRDNILANTKARTEAHAKNSCYVSTRCVDTASDALSKDHVVWLTGKAGSGKTTVALEIMRKLSENTNATPVILNSSDHWDNVVNCDENIVIFLDDPFGKSNLDDKEYEKWEKRFDNIADAGQCKFYVIVGIRNHILAKFRRKTRKYLCFFKEDNVINLSIGDNKLSQDEKFTMLKKYMDYYKRSLSLDVINALIETEPYYGFPQTCFLFFSNKSLFNLGLGFFKHPDQALRNEVDSLRKSNDISKTQQYCVLVYTLMYGHIDTTDANLLEEIQDISVLISPCPITMGDIKDAIKCLSNTYLDISSIEIVLGFKHETILEAMLLSFGEQQPERVIRLCSNNVLNELIKPANYQCRPDEVVLKIPITCYHALVGRLVSSSQLVCHDFHSLDERRNILRFIDEACCDPKFEETLSNLAAHQSIAFKFFIACRFGKKKMVKRMLEQIGNSPFGLLFNFHKKVMGISHVSVKSFSNEQEKLKEKLTRCVIMHGLYQSIIKYQFSTVKVIVDYDKHLVHCEYSGYGDKSYLSMFHVACLEKHVSIDIIKYLFTFKPDYQRPNAFGRTLLHECVRYDRTDVLQFLFDADNALVNIVDGTNDPLICYAGMMKKKACVELMCKYNPDIRCSDSWGETLLHYCVTNDWDDILNKLIAHDINLLNLENQSGDTIICYAGKKQRKTIVKTLYTQKPNIKRFDSSGKTLIHYCIDNDWSDVVTELIFDKPKRVNSTNKDGDPLICYAAKRNKKSLVLFLYEQRAILQQFDSFGKTMLHYCIDNEWHYMLNTLFIRDPTLAQLTDKYGDPLVIYAALTNKKEIVILMREYIAGSILKRDMSGNTLLHYCVKANWRDIIEMFINENPALVNMADARGEPLISYATKEKKESIIILLCKNKADINVYDAYGKSLTHHFLRNGWCDALKCLINDEPSFVNHIDKRGDPLLCCAAKLGQKSVVRLLLDNGADHKLNDSSGKTFLHYCIDNDWYDVFEASINADHTLVDVMDCRGNSLFFYAVETSKKDYVYLLQRYNADIRSRNCLNKTVLHLCVDNEWYDMFDILMRQDPDLVNLRDSKGDSLIFYAAKLMRKTMVVRLCECKPDLTLLDSTGTTLLHYCLFYDWYDIMEALIINEHSLVNLTSKDGDSILCCAARRNKRVLVNFLLKFKPNIHCFCRLGKTLLHYCVDNGWRDVLETLVIDTPTFLKATDKDGKTLLCYAARLENKDMFEFLYTKLQAKIDFHDNCAMTVLRLCLSHNWFDVLDLLITDEPRFALMTDTEGYSLMYYAAMLEKKDFVTSLCQHLKDVKQLDPCALQVVRYCVYNDWCDVLETLIKDDPTLINKVDDKGDSLLCFAARMKKRLAVMLLIDYKVDVKQKYSSHKTLLHYCIENDWSDLLQILVDKDNTLINVRDTGVDPPMCYAARQNKIELAMCLLKHNGDVRLHDKRGKTFVHHCVHNDWHNVLKLLIKADPTLVNLTDKKGTPLIHYAAFHVKKQIVIFLIQNDADIQKTDQQGKALLHLCIDNDWVDVLESCINGNPRLIYVTDDSGDTPLCYAAEQKQKAIAISLYEHWADVTIRNRFGKTLLHYCIDNDWSDLLDRLLKDNHAFRHLTDADGDTLICYAANHEKFAMVKCLYENGAEIRHFDCTGNTMLHYCVDNDWSVFFREMIFADGTLVNITDKHGSPLICYAAEQKRDSFVKYLYKQNTSITGFDYLGKTLLHHCVDNNWFDILDMILSTNPTLIDTTDCIGDQLQFYMTREIRKLVQDDKTENIVEEQCNTSFIHMCVDNNWFRVLETAVKVDPTLVTLAEKKCQNPVICYAALKKRKEIVLLLLSIEVEVARYDTRGKSLLHHCIDNAWDDVLTNIISTNPLLINHTDNDGCPLVCYAASIKSPKMVFFLTNQNADITKADATGKTLLHFCISNNWYDMLETFAKSLSSSSDDMSFTGIDSLISFAAAQNRKNMVTLLSDYVNDITYFDNFGKTLLHYCVDRYWDDVLEILLIKNPLCVNLTDRHGEPLSCYASKQHKKAAVTLLCKYKVDVMHYDQCNKTLLHYLVQNDASDILTILFKQNNSMVNFVDKHGDPLICFAAHQKKHDMVEFLCYHSAGKTCYDSRGKTVFHYCIDNCWVDILKTYIKNKEILSLLTDKRGDSLVSYAARKNKGDMFKYLQ